MMDVMMLMAIQAMYPVVIMQTNTYKLIAFGDSYVEYDTKGLNEITQTNNCDFGDLLACDNTAFEVLL